MLAACSTNITTAQSTRFASINEGVKVNENNIIIMKDLTTVWLQGLYAVTQLPERERVRKEEKNLR